MNLIGTIDLTGVTNELTSASGSIVAGGALVAVAALALGGFYFGGRSLWRFFKSLAR